MKKLEQKRSYHRFTEQERRFIRRWYANVQTCCIAHLLGLTTDQVEGYVERNSGEPWAHKNQLKKRTIRSFYGVLGADARWHR